METRISIIIPTFNEADNIGPLLEHLNTGSSTNPELIVVDGGSSDETIPIADKAGAKVITSTRGRAAQMNTGGHNATGNILYFLHADSHPPQNFDSTIVRAVQGGHCAGSFRLQFDDEHPVLRLTAWLVNRLKRLRLGDQSLFVDRRIFEQVGGYDESLIIMEDADIVRRIRARTVFTVLPETIITSARKFRDNGELRLLLIFTLIFWLYERNVSQQRLLGIYKRLIRQDKI